ncbi:hypothetical protein LCGC14_0513560, partial [marine sediment metagenome]
EGRGGYIDRFEDLLRSHYALKRKVYVAAAFLAGSGVITGTVLGVINGV